VAGSALGSTGGSAPALADVAARAADGAADAIATPASRSRESFEAAVAPYQAALVRRLVVVLRDEAAAQDIAQDACLAAFRAWPRFDGRDVRGWLYTIALRLAFNERRRHRRWLAAVRRIEPRPWTDPVDPDLWAALAALDVRTRAALLLNVVDGYTQREIATLLSVPEGTVASWLSRGRARLREMLADRTEG
jgi:RNA polymerase sigma-70 factor (ECF subfamily)